MDEALVKYDGHLCNDAIMKFYASYVFTGLFIHGMLPPSMISVVLVPIVKDKRASVCSTSNYRPIALASIMSKLLEKIILNRTSDNLVTNPNQFGFKPNHNTKMCILALKEAILKYRALNSNVYSGFLDARRLTV